MTRTHKRTGSKELVLEPRSWSHRRSTSSLACATAVRTLQEFLRNHVWDHLRMRDQLQRRVAEQPLPSTADDLGTVGVIDETSVAKKGTKTPGVQRQWCGSLGKTENCIVTVHLGVVCGRFKTLGKIRRSHWSRCAGR